MQTVIWIYIISEILVILSRSSIGICLAGSSPHLNFNYFCSSKNYMVFQDNDILSVLFLSKFLTRTFIFFDHSLPVLYPYPHFQIIPSQYYIRTNYFKFSPYFVLIPSLYLGTGTEKVRNPSPYSGVWGIPRLPIFRKVFWSLIWI